MARVLVSAGHTNKDPGTTISGVREVDLTRKIAQEVTKRLRELNIITLSVPPDLDLARRIEWINQTGYSETNRDISIEIHINDGGKSGIEGWYQADKTDSQQLTNELINEVMKSTNWPSQGVKSEYEHPLGSLAFLHNTNTIATLIECGYLDNEENMAFLKNDENIKKIAKGIVLGIQKFFGFTTTQTTPTTPATPTTPPKQQQQPSTFTPAPVATPTPAASGPLTTGYTPPAQTQAPSTYRPPRRAPSTYGQPGAQPGVQPAGTEVGAGGSSYMNREQRREMIKNYYIKILGRGPNQADLNYFLNIGISEDQLTKKMVDSQEHADLVVARQEVIKTKKQFVDQNNELLRLKAKANDQQGILRNLNGLLMQKNRAIHDLQQRLKAAGFRPSKPVQKTRKPKYKKSFQERILDFLSSRLG